MTHTPTLRVKQYLAARSAKPMDQLGDIIHSVNIGSPFEGELLLSDLREFNNAHDKLVEALRKLANEVTALGSFEGELRAELGNTNYNVLMLRVLEARAALEGLE